MCIYVVYVSYVSYVVKKNFLESLCFKSLNIKALEFKNPYKRVDDHLIIPIVDKKSAANPLIKAQAAIFVSDPRQTKPIETFNNLNVLQPVILLHFRTGIFKGNLPLTFHWHD